MGKANENGTDTGDTLNESREDFIPNSYGDQPLVFEDIIESLGSFGHWQRVIFVLISSADVFGAMCMLIPVFIGDIPKWRCARFENEANATMWTTMWTDANLTNFESCENNGSKCVEFEFNKDEFTSIIGEWSLVCKKNYLSDLISSVQMGGVFLGAAIFGQLSDTFGRKRMYYLSFAIQIGAGMISAASVNWQMYAVCRFLVGAGFGAYMVINCVYPLEFVGHQWRILCGTIGFWAVGLMMLAGIGYLIRDWRYLTAATTVTGVVFFITWIVVPESPRWLVQQRRYDDAQKILEVIARKNNRPPPKTELLRRFADADKAEQEELKKYTYLDLFRRWIYAKRTIILALLWFTCFLAYYELSFNLKNLSGDRYLNMFLGGFVDLAAMVIVLLLLNRIGRRISMTLFLCVSVAALISIVIVIVTGNEEAYPSAVLGLALTGKASSLAGTYNVQILSAEIFPTVIRNVGLGSGAIAGRIGGMLAPLLVYMGGLYKLGPYIVCSILAAVSIPTIFFLHETTGKPLEDTYDNKSSRPLLEDKAPTNVTLPDTVAESTKV